MVRHLPALLQTPDLAALRLSGGRAVAVPGLEEWARTAAQAEDYPRLLVAVAVLRLARQFAEAGRLLRAVKNVPSAWRAATANEEAALAWHRGDGAQAVELWRAQAESVPVLFNCGMAALFLGKAAEARAALSQAADRLPEDGAWHHLARLYLALAEMRG